MAPPPVAAPPQPQPQPEAEGPAPIEEEEEAEEDASTPTAPPELHPVEGPNLHWMERPVRPWEVLSEENAGRLFRWIDADSDGVISVLEFTSVTSGSKGKTASSAKDAGVERDTRVTSEGSAAGGAAAAAAGEGRAHIPGAKMLLSDFERVHLFQDIDQDSSHVLDYDEFVGFIASNRARGMPAVVAWAADILYQLDEVEAGRVPVYRGIRAKGVDEHGDDGQVLELEAHDRLVRLRCTGARSKKRRSPLR